METLTVVTTIMVALITAVFGPIIVQWTMKKFEKSTPQPIQEAIELNQLVDEQLGIMFDEIQCDRIWIAQFHNGGHFYPTGKSIQKFSIFYENLTPDTISIQQIFQNIPVSFFPKALAHVYDKGELSVSMCSNETFTEKIDTYGLEALFANSKILHIVGLYNLEDQLIGLMGISYNRDVKLTKDVWIFIRQKVGVVGTLLSRYLQTKK